jgi:AraC-like DNA-binding protein
MQVEAINILQFIFVFQAIFGALLISKNHRYRGLFFMAILLALSMTFNLFEEMNISRQYYLVTPIFTLGKGPIFYLFVYRLVFPETAFTRQHLLHLVPMLVTLPLTTWPQIVIALGTFSQFFYAALVLRLVYKYHRASEAMRSDADSLQLKWVVAALSIYLLLELLDLVRLNLQPYIPYSVNVGGQFFGTSAGLILFSFLIIKAVQNPSLFNGMQNYLNMMRLDRSGHPDSEIALTVFEHLKNQVIGQSLHHKPRLSLSDLADETGLNIRDISRAINISSGRNFNDFINELRIEDIKQQLANAKDTPKILDLALTVGFGSKSTFNAVFKRETGLTPSEYLRQLNK